jgi:hypothetical protein
METKDRRFGTRNSYKSINHRGKMILQLKNTVVHLPDGLQLNKSSL